jgi:hypothetical protein
MKMPDPDRSIPPRVDLPGPRVCENIAGSLVTREVGAPRQFGIGTLLVITTMYAVLFAVMSRCAPVDFFVTALFFTTVGLGQMLLFKGKRPRRASIIVGACYLPCAFIVELVRDQTLLLFADSIAGFVWFLMFVPVAGAGCGHMVGLLIAGVVLGIGKLRAPRSKC